MSYLQQYFKCFLDNDVKLNKTRKDKLVTIAKSLTSYLESCEEFKDLTPKVKIQGSWSTHTMIKPLKDGGEVDIDLVLCLDRNSEWENDPKKYLHVLYSALSKNNQFKDKCHYNKRCVTLEYANECSVDITPLINLKLIVNRKENIFEISPALEYTAWFNSLRVGTKLHRVAQLLKYIKSRTTEFEIPSIALTTLIGVYSKGKGKDRIEDELLNCLQNIQYFFQSYSTIPRINNPVNTSENLARDWTEPQFNKFKKFLDTTIPKIEEAINASDKEDAINIWKDIFGDKFPSRNSSCVEEASKKSKDGINTNAYTSTPYFK